MVFRLLCLTIFLSSAFTLSAQTTATAPPKPVTLLQIVNVTPVPKSPDYKPYLDKINDKILRNSSLRQIHFQTNPASKATGVFSFLLTSTGSIASNDVKILASTGDKELDSLIVGSIPTGQVLDQFPDSFHLASILYRLTIRISILPDASFKPLYESAKREANARDFNSASQIMESLLSDDPDYTGGWGYLGWLYIQLGNYAKAEVPLEKAILQNPFDEFAFNNLGISLMHQKKYSEAIAQYKKQLEINPKDLYAYANLGRLYLQTGQPELAVPALQSAAMNTPNDPVVYFNLGRAYAAIHDKDSALKAFQHSEALEPIPSRRNAIAYELAVDGIALEQASSYANLAISEVANRLREVNPEHPTAEDLRKTNSLAAYWDTLGWIRFRMGDLTGAEKYVRCAWQFSSSSEVSDHLGQIYEKLGRKNEAMRHYAFALAAAFPHEESRAPLLSLAGSDAQAQELIIKARAELNGIHSISIKNAHGANGTADFWIVLAPGPRIRGVSYVTGDESLRPFTIDLGLAVFPDVFPEATETQLVRRGRLSCTAVPASQCLLSFSSVLPASSTN